MASEQQPGRKTHSGDPFDLVRRLQAAVEDREAAVCLAARTAGEYKEGATCGNRAGGRRHTISNAAYLTQIAENGLVLSPLPTDAPHIAHHTRANSRKARKSRVEITHLPPKPTLLGNASTWHFACEEHDDKFKPIDKGIPFPNSHDYMRITTEGTAEADRELEEALFLMAYRSVLSSLSILRGVCKALERLLLERGNHLPIIEQKRQALRSYNELMKYKLPYDARFAGARGYSMDHHLIAAQPHTNLAMSRVYTYATTNILPDNGISRIVVSHAASEKTDRQQEVENWVTEIPQTLSDRNNKGPFIDLVATSFDAYISPADYKDWMEEDKDSLTRAAAQQMREFLFY